MIVKYEKPEGEGLITVCKNIPQTVVMVGSGLCTELCVCCEKHNFSERTVDCSYNPDRGYLVFKYFISKKDLENLPIRKGTVIVNVVYRKRRTKRSKNDS